MSSPSPSPSPSLHKSSVADLRVNYSNEPLVEQALHVSPFPLFATWMQQATAADEHEPNAMCLATVDQRNRPTARMVLLKAYDTHGFVWYTNYNSRKAQHLQSNFNAALTFWWPTLQRSVRIEGIARKVPDAESQAYFDTRPIDSRLAAWASDQSSVVHDPAHLQHRWTSLKNEFLDHNGQLVKPLLRPPHWGGYRLVPSRIEFWKGRSARLHDRILYERSDDDGHGDGHGDAQHQWTKSRLQP